MGAKGFFRSVGHGIQHAGDALGKSAGKAFGGALGGAAANYALETAPLMFLKTGGRVKGGKNKAVPAILHGGEHVLPYGVKLTKKQKDAIAKNKQQQRIHGFC